MLNGTLKINIRSLEACKVLGGDVLNFSLDDVWEAMEASGIHPDDADDTMLTMTVGGETWEALLDDVVASLEKFSNLEFADALKGCAK